MRYYDVPDRPVTDPTTGETRPTRIGYFDGGIRTTRFVDPETGLVYRAEYVGCWASGTPTEFRRPIRPGRDARLRDGGGPTRWVAGSTRKSKLTS